MLNLTKFGRVCPKELGGPGDRGLLPGGCEDHFFGILCPDLVVLARGLWDDGFLVVIRRSVLNVGISVGTSVFP